MVKALITGIPGQDGSYLAELLLDKDYEVHGVVRRTSSLERSRLTHLYQDRTVYGHRLFLHYADLDDPTTLRRILLTVAPEQIYHLAGPDLGHERVCDAARLGDLAVAPQRPLGVGKHKFDRAALVGVRAPEPVGCVGTDGM